MLDYEQLDELPAGRAVYVDMSGDAAVRSAVHEHFGDELAHSAVVGATHHDRMGGVPDELPGPRPTFFFAPDRVAKRGAEWGREGLEQRLAEAWGPYVQWTDGWLEVIHEEGPEALRAALPGPARRPHRPIERARARAAALAPGAAREPPVRSRQRGV